jgi:hypothetical protein
MTTLADLTEENLERYEIQYRVHATRQMFARYLSNEDVERVLSQGQIIERYDDDLPLRRALLNGRSATGRPIHVVVVVSLSEKRMTIITAYEPDSARWSRNFTRRRS